MLYTPSMTNIQRLAALYALMFLGVVSLGYIPGFTDENGLLLGLFKIDPIDDVLHGASGLWAALSAWHSAKASRFYFRAFGTYYTADAVIGLITGWSSLDPQTNVAINLPHLILGPLALAIGFLWHRRLSTKG